jgi:Ca-activated chloride channel homolog
MLYKIVVSVLISVALFAQQSLRNSTAAPSPLGPESTSSSSSDQDAITTIRKSVNEVNVVFTVTDKRGRFINDLQQSDVQVLDDKKPPSAISAFRSETDLPLRVGILIDASNSIRDRFKFEQDAAVEFLNRIVRSGSDKALVIGFDTTSEVTQEFTDDLEKLARGVKVLRPGGGTAMYDAIYYACRDRLLAAGKETGTVRRAVILISDGEDNQSRFTREEAVEMAQRAEVIIFAISTNISGVKMRGDKVLERFAEATGGRVFFPFKLSEVSDAFSQIEAELRSQYVLSYKPADLQSNGEFRTIEIAVANNKKLKVRARKGYFAPRE